MTLASMLGGGLVDTPGKRPLSLMRNNLAGVALSLALLAMPQHTSAQPQALFGNNNIEAVENRPTQETIVTLKNSAMIVKITTYHWNNGNGTSAIGSISLWSQAGEFYGPWQAEGQPGHGGVPNAYWVAYPNVRLPAGSYTVIDSDPATWAQNAASGRAGMTWAEGYVQ